MTSPLRSALNVEVPPAEPVVAHYRASMDTFAGLGVPAHITALFPFLPAATIDAEVREELLARFAAIPRFAFVLARTDWFGSEVLWLAPEPEEPFRELTELLTARYPDLLPYGGQFDSVVPHLTIADRADLGAMRQADAEVRGRLPIRAEATAVTLLAEQTSGRWLRAETFPLGPAAG